MTTHTDSSIEIQRGIPASQRRRAAEIYHAAFERKLSPILGADYHQAIELLADGLHTENAFVALREGQVLGLVGFHHDGHSLIDVRFGQLVNTFGIFSASWRAFLGIILSRQPGKHELLLDGIAVHADARGQGVGTRLFDAIFAFAAENDYTHIRLDVVNSNPRARQLYERLGFVAVKTDSVPFMKPMGFTAVTTMTLDITARNRP